MGVDPMTQVDQAVPALADPVLGGRLDPGGHRSIIAFPQLCQPGFLRMSALKSTPISASAAHRTPAMDPG